MDLRKRRAAARKEILDAADLIDVARRGVHGVPDLFLARIQIAVARLEMLDRAEDADRPAIRAPGRIDFPEPLAAFEPSVRTRKQRRRS